MSASTPAKSATGSTRAASNNPPNEDAVVESESPDKGADATGANGARIRKRRLDVNPNLILSDGRSKRRKTPTPEPEDKKENLVEDGVYDPKDPQRAKTLGLKLYNKLLKSKSTDGEDMAEPFIELPDKEAFPDYYETIKHPVSFNMVKKKLDKAEYENLKAVVTDIGQIFVNAKRYNVKESVIFQFAKKLHKTTRTFYEEASDPANIPAPKAPTPPPPAPEPKVEEEEEEDPTHSVEQSMEPEDHIGGPSNQSIDGDSLTGNRGRKRGSYMKDGPTVYKLVKPLLKLIKEAKSRDGSGREIAGIFMDLPDTRDFADYYQTIARPISLKQIEDRMIGRTYQQYQEFYDDIGLMCRNAMTYNEDESEVFKDAQQILDIMEGYRGQIEDRINRPAVDKPRPRVSGPTPRADSSSFAQRQSYPYPNQTPNYPSQSPQPLSGPSGASHGSYLPALPKGVVTEEIVASLDRYPPYEQSAWANSLPPFAVQVYRQLSAANDAKKRGLQAPATTQSSTLADLPSTARTNGVTILQDRLAPPLPTIKYLDFAFSTAGNADRSSAIRLHNMRGVVTHAVVLGSDTSELELTAYIADPPKDSTTEIQESVPELSLRVNGNQASLPKVIHQGEGTRPAGMRWTISVPPNRNETRVEVIAMSPGKLAETSAIYVSRQY